LVHLVRNAIDHGIETPAERRAVGKPADGMLRIVASQEGNSIVIRIQDDGRGIALDKVKAKALARGLVSEAELSSMEPREIINLIFLPGFSTAETVTDVSAWTSSAPTFDASTARWRLNPNRAQGARLRSSCRSPSPSFRH
jgi:two-component system chemotaxis sensor kinase CheA